MDISLTFWIILPKFWFVTYIFFGYKLYVDCIVSFVVRWNVTESRFFDNSQLDLHERAKLGKMLCCLRYTCALGRRCGITVFIFIVHSTLITWNQTVLLFLLAKCFSTFLSMTGLSKLHARQIMHLAFVFDKTSMFVCRRLER